MQARCILRAVEVRVNWRISVAWIRPNVSKHGAGVSRRVLGWHVSAFPQCVMRARPARVHISGNAAYI